LGQPLDWRDLLSFTYRLESISALPQSFNAFGDSSLKGVKVTTRLSFIGDNCSMLDVERVLSAGTLIGTDHNYWSSRGECKSEFVPDIGIVSGYVS
jgi:hypothetical protein